MRLLYEKAYFDYTEIINLAVQFLEGDEDDDEDAAAVRGHIRDDIRYVVVDEYQDVNPLQERLVRGLTQFGANLCVVGDDDQTIYQWRGSEVSNIVTFADRYAGVHQVTLAENFRSSEGVVEVGQVGRGADPRRQSPAEGDGAGGAPELGAGRPDRSRFRGRGRGGRVDLRSHRGDARARLPRHGRQARRGACRGRTSPCCSGRSRRTLTRWSRRCAGATSRTSSRA